MAPNETGVRQIGIFLFHARYVKEQYEISVRSMNIDDPRYVRPTVRPSDRPQALAHSLIGDLKWP